MLHETVFPRVRTFCRELGYEFVVVDLMSNIAQPFPEDHTYLEISAREIALCQVFLLF